jgi:PII-like signaling protein
VHHGIMGFGTHMKVHHKRLFGISDDKPIVITVVDNEQKIREILPEIKTMVTEGLIVLLDVEVIEI